MGALVLYSKLEMLPEHLKQQVLDYVEFLLSRETKAQKEAKPSTEKSHFKPGFGGAKGMFVISPDFDEPLEDFKEYM